MFQLHSFSDVPILLIAHHICFVNNKKYKVHYTINNTIYFILRKPFGVWENLNGGGWGATGELYNISVFFLK